MKITEENIQKNVDKIKNEVIQIKVLKVAEIEEIIKNSNIKNYNPTDLYNKKENIEMKFKINKLYDFYECININNISKNKEIINIESSKKIPIEATNFDLNKLNENVNVSSKKEEKKEINEENTNIIQDQYYKIKLKNEEKEIKINNFDDIQSQCHKIKFKNEEKEIKTDNTKEINIEKK